MSILSENFVIVNYSAKKKEEQLLENAQKKLWKDALDCTTTYLKIYMKQITKANVLNRVCITTEDLSVLYPYPMFECIIKHDSWSATRRYAGLVNKGMAMDFLVLYAEAEILKSLIN